MITSDLLVKFDGAGNDFHIIDHVTKTLCNARDPPEEIDQFCEEAMSGGDRDLLRICGQWVTLAHAARVSLALDGIEPDDDQVAIRHLSHEGGQRLIPCTSAVPVRLAVDLHTLRDTFATISWRAGRTCVSCKSGCPTIEALRRSLRKIIKTRGGFPNEACEGEKCPRTRLWAAWRSGR
jgi:hypothetical protein